MKLIAALLIATAAGAAQARQTPQPLTITPERTRFEETSRYEDVMAFLKAVDAASSRIHLTTPGGTAIPLRHRDRTPSCCHIPGRTQGIVS